MNGTLAVIIAILGLTLIGVLAVWLDRNGAIVPAIITAILGLGRALTK